MQKVEDLCAHVDNDLKAGVFDIATAGHVKKYILRAVEVIRNLGIQAEVNAYTAQGRIQGTQKTIALTKAMFDAERASVAAMEAIEKAVAAGEEVRPHERVSGVHPGNPLADRVRKADPLPPAVDTLAPTEPPPKPEPSVETKSTDPVEEAVAMVTQAEVTPSIAKVGSDDPFDMLDALAGSSSDSGPSSPELTASTPKRTRRKGG
jgi:hypothetical protein